MYSAMFYRAEYANYCQTSVHFFKKYLRYQQDPINTLKMAKVKVHVALT